LENKNKQSSSAKGNIGSKRQAHSQATAFSTPSCHHTQSRLKSACGLANGVSGVVIEKILVYNVNLKTPVVGDTWFKAKYVVAFSSKNRVKIYTEKKFWHDGDFTNMMNKTQAAILGLVDTMGLNLSAGEGPSYMQLDWPWNYLKKEKCKMKHTT